MFCNKPIRKKILKPSIFIDKKNHKKESKNLINVSYDIENSSFTGVIRYNSKTPSQVISNNIDVSTDLSKYNTFEILDFDVKGLESNVNINFNSNTISSDGYVLGPGLALTICSQLVIIHIYSISDVKKKNKGVVVSNFKYNCINNIKSNNTINFRSIVKKIRTSNKSHKYIEVNVECLFNDGDTIVELTYFFEPFF